MSIWAIDWLLSVTQQFVAVSGYKKQNHHVLGQKDFSEEDNLVQIWSFDVVSGANLYLGISLPYGDVFDLKWCPLQFVRHCVRYIILG